MYCESAILVGLNRAMFLLSGTRRVLMIFNTVRSETNC